MSACVANRDVILEASVRNSEASQCITMARSSTAMARSSNAKEASSPKRWSQWVTTHSNALDLEQGVFAVDSPVSIAKSLKRSAETSNRRKASPFQSAMSMLNFYINRAGKNLPEERKRVLNDAKTELRRLYGR
jgi:hypothetical protein